MLDVSAGSAGAVARERAVHEGTRRGHIINVSSVAGFLPMGTYSAAKAWVTVFTEVLPRSCPVLASLRPRSAPVSLHTEFHQRPDVDVSRLPKALWLDAELTVRDWPH